MGGFIQMLGDLLTRRKQPQLPQQSPGDIMGNPIAPGPSGAPRYGDPGIGGGSPTGVDPWQQMIAMMKPPQQAGPSSGGGQPQRQMQGPGPNMAPIFAGGQGGGSAGQFGPSNLTAAAQTGPGIMPQPSAATGGQTEWNTRSGKNMALTTNAINSIGQFVGQYKQQKWTKAAGSSEQAWNSYLGLQKAIADTQDPQAKQQLQQQLQQMMQDPKFAKVMSKAHDDPTSPEGVGLQRAMMTSQSQAMQQAALEEQRNKAFAEHERGLQEQATAALRTKQALQLGTVTPALKAIIGEQQKRVEGQIQIGRDKNQSMLDATDRRMSALERIAHIKAGATRQDKQKKMALDSLSKQYEDINKTIANLDKEEKQLQTDLSTHFIQNFFGDKGDLTRQKIAEIQQRRAALDQQLQGLEQKRQTMNDNLLSPEEQAEFNREDTEAPAEGDQGDQQGPKMTISPEGEITFE